MFPCLLVHMARHVAAGSKFSSSSSSHATTRAVVVGCFACNFVPLSHAELKTPTGSRPPSMKDQVFKYWALADTSSDDDEVVEPEMDPWSGRSQHSPTFFWGATQLNVLRFSKRFANDTVWNCHYYSSALSCSTLELHANCLSSNLFLSDFGDGARSAQSCQLVNADVFP
jgi:hypothetical protein